MVLCEGHSGAEVAKRILKKMESEGIIGRISLKVGFTDVSGRDNVPTMLDAILSLARSSHRLKDIVVVIDGDEYSVDDRVKSIVDSLASRGALVEGLQRDGVSNQVYISRGEGSRIGAPEGYDVRAPGWLRDVRVPIRFLYRFPQSSFEVLGEPGFGFKGFQGVV